MFSLYYDSDLMYVISGFDIHTSSTMLNGLYQLFESTVVLVYNISGFSVQYQWF